MASMTFEDVMSELKSYGNENTVKIYSHHATEIESFGVKVADMKKIVKKVKKDHELSLKLFDTGIYDPMYLAGLIADEQQMTKELLEHWVNHCKTHLIAEYTVAWVASESPYGWELGMKWIDSDQELIAAAGWSCLTNVISITPDEALEQLVIHNLLQRVKDEIHQAPNRVRYCMNGFVIGIGGYYKPLLNEAKEIAQVNGKVDVYMGKTSCKVPYAPDYIKKIEDKGRVGKKRKQARC